MCEPAMPIIVLKDIRFSLSSLAKLAGSPGSCEQRNLANAVKGIEADLNWCIANLEAAGEGQKNFGLSAYPPVKKTEAREETGR